MRRHITISVILVSAVLAGAAFVLNGRATLAFQQWSDVQPGDTVEVLIPADGNQPEPAGVHPPTDKIVYTGGRIVDVETTGCAFGTRPVQQAVLIDPGGMRPSRPVYIITVASTFSPVPPGTRLTNLLLMASCSFGGDTFNRYRGTVE